MKTNFKKFGVGRSKTYVSGESEHICSHSSELSASNANLISSNKYLYPSDILDYIDKSFRNKQTKLNVIEFYNYILLKINETGKRWIDIPTETIRALLGDHYDKILPRLIKHINVNHSFSITYHKCKQYTFNSETIELYARLNNLPNFVKYINTLLPIVKSTDTAEQFVNNLNISNSSYTIDKDALILVMRDIIEIREYPSEINKQATIQTIKKQIKIMISGEDKDRVSENNGRHYNNKTQTLKEIRKCLIKNTEKYVGELDLKCCHGFIIINLLKHLLSNTEYIELFEFFKDINLWSKLMTITNIASKDKIKSKMQLFFNGYERDNGCNPIYKYFKLEYPHFTELLFQFKDGMNLSNEVNKIEASVMHSKEVADYMKSLNLNYDIIHDCFWLYGTSDAMVIGKAAQFVLNQFKEKHDIDMVFAIELISKPKQIVTMLDYHTDYQNKIKYAAFVEQYIPLNIELNSARRKMFTDKNDNNVNLYYNLKTKLDDLIYANKDVIAYVYYHKSDDAALNENW